MAKRAYGTGRIYKPEGCQFFYAEWRHNGKQYRTSTRTTSKMEAEQFLRKEIERCGIGQLPTNDIKKVTYEQLRDGLLKYAHEQNLKSLQVLSDGEETIWGMKALDEFFAGFKVPQITTTSARRFAEEREKQGIGNAAINRSLALLRQMLNLAKEDRLINDVPTIRMRKEPAPRQGFLPREKFEELLAALPPCLQPLIVFLYWCGVRLGEALQIQWNQGDLQAGLIELEPDQTKSGDARVVPLPDVLIRMLESVEERKGPVFDGTNLRKAWHKACVAVGLGTLTEVPGKSYGRYEGLIIHDLRRSAIRNLMDAGVGESVAMKISGHKTNSVFKRYNIISKDDVLTAMRRVEKKNGHTLPASQPKALPSGS